jgi:hypothetical protein
MATPTSHRLISLLSSPPVADRFIVENFRPSLPCAVVSIESRTAFPASLSPPVHCYNRSRCTILPGGSCVINYAGVPHTAQSPPETSPSPLRTQKSLLCDWLSAGSLQQLTRPTSHGVIPSK